MESLHFVLYLIALRCLMLLPAAISEEKGDSTCMEACGNVTIPSPFGIKDGCYANSWFRVSCREIDGNKKPYIIGINMELLGSSSPGTVTVNNPVTHVNCGNKGYKNGIVVVPNLNDSPFLFTTKSNAVGSVGCGNMVTVVSTKSDTVIGGCMQASCDGVTSKDSYVVLSEHSVSLSDTIVKIDADKNQKSNTCYSVFIISLYSLNLDSKTLDNLPSHAPAALEWNIPECQSEGRGVQYVYADSACKRPGTGPNDPNNCTTKCGNVDIPYPFGIETGCFMNDSFQVTCNETDAGLIPVISKFNLQLLSVSFPLGIVRVNHPVSYSNCLGNIAQNGSSVNLTGSSLFYSNIFSRFGSVGCGSLATISSIQTDLISSCLLPTCISVSSSGSSPPSPPPKSFTSFIVDICLNRIPPGISYFVANMTAVYPGNDGSKIPSCGSAFMFDVFEEDPSPFDMIHKSYIPTTLRWAKPKAGLCELKDGSKTFCSSGGEYCWTNLSSNYLCVCSNAENSVPYSSDVCREAGKCSDPTYNLCHMLCLNEPNKYCSSLCPEGYTYSGDKCKPIKLKLLDRRFHPLHWVVLGCGTSIGTVVMLLAGWRMHRILKTRKKIKLRKKNFKKNGGLLLQQQFSVNEGNVDKIKLFTSKELEKATDYYNQNRILGRGGQGTVYKGMLADGSIVAIKKSKMIENSVNEKMLQQFINEVIILSQINHRNVVKLLGCCLETKVPLLVYEFVPNGNLSQLLHDQNEEFPFTWAMRLRIATEVGNALSYLHSAASVPIYHRDIKSSNILLDGKYRAKVSDFGTSRSIALDQTHITTPVQGTFGYIDPEYFLSSQFTEKSDVNSFGVVLVELITGKRPICSRQCDEEKSLVLLFLLSMKKDSLFEILDPRLENDGAREEIIAVAKLARKCLNLNGKKRPIMKQVVAELELIRESEEANGVRHSVDEDWDINDDAMVQCWSMDSTSTDQFIINDTAIRCMLLGVC